MLAIGAPLVLLPASPAAAAGDLPRTEIPHKTLTSRVVAFTDSATPGTLDQSGGFIPVGSRLVDGVRHTSRAYVTFETDVNAARLKHASLKARESSVNDCSRDRSLVVYRTADLDATSSWNTPPAEISRAGQVSPAEDCPSYDLSFRVTDALRAAAQEGKRYLTLEIRVPNGAEQDVARGREFYGWEFKLDIFYTNTRPDAPTNARWSIGNEPCSAGTRFVGQDQDVAVDQTDPDREPWDSLTQQFEFWPVDHPEQVAPLPGQGTDSQRAWARIPTSQLTEGTSYLWRARTNDGRAWGPWGEKCRFTVDRTAPAEPLVSSKVYPENPPRPTPGPEFGGTFTFAANGSADVVRYYYGSRRSEMWHTATPERHGGSVTVEPFLWDTGPQSLFVQSMDRAGNLSPVKEYKFNVANLHFNAYPAEQVPAPDGSSGMAVTFHFNTQPDNGITHFQWRIDGGELRSVPVGADGTATAVVSPLTGGEHSFVASARLEDGTSTPEWSEPSQFTVDDSPSSSSEVYPHDGAGGMPGVAGSFTFTSRLPGAVSFSYRFDYTEAPMTVAAGPDGKATVTSAPPTAGAHYLWVTTYYAGGGKSSVGSFSFTVLSNGPTVTSTDFPEDNWGGRIGQPGSFAFAARLDGTTTFEYSIDGGPWSSVPAVDGRATVSWTPASAYWHTINVRGVRADGSTSEATAYSFLVNS